MSGSMISVVIPTYNEEKNIEACLEAINAQTLPRSEFEVIIVDWHSKDRTAEIAQKLGAKVIQQTSKGVGGARNDGFAVAKGDILVTTDADCIPDPRWLESVKRNFQSGIVGAFGPQVPVEDDLRAKIVFKFMDWSACLCSVLNIIYMGGPNSSFRKDAFNKISGYSALPSFDDVEIGFRLKRLGKIAYDPGMVVKASARRFNKYGYMRTLIQWKINDLNTRLGRNTKEGYAKQTY